MKLNMKASICIPAIVFCLLTIHAHAGADRLTIGISTGYPPYYYKQENKFSGICIEIVNSVAEKMGLDVEYREYPWKRLIQSGREGSVDAIMPLFRTSEREQFLDFNGLEMVYETNQFFASQEAIIPKIVTFENFSSFRIGVVTDYSYGTEFDSFAFSRKVITQNDKHLINMFIHGRFEIGVGNKDVIRYYANMEGIAETIRFIEPPITQEMLYLGFTKTGERYHLAKDFSRALREFKSSPAYRNLIDKYGMAETAVK